VKLSQFYGHTISTAFYGTKTLYRNILLYSITILLCDVYALRGLCCGNMSVCPSVCLSHTGVLLKWLNSKHILNLFTIG